MAPNYCGPDVDVTCKRVTECPAGSVELGRETAVPSEISDRVCGPLPTSSLYDLSAFSRATDPTRMLTIGSMTFVEPSDEFLRNSVSRMLYVLLPHAS